MNIFLACLRAFLIGGAFCVIGSGWVCHSEVKLPSMAAFALPGLLHVWPTTFHICREPGSTYCAGSFPPSGKRTTMSDTSPSARSHLTVVFFPPSRNANSFTAGSRKWM